jgi:hypothetical protein
LENAPADPVAILSTKRSVSRQRQAHAARCEQDVRKLRATLLSLKAIAANTNLMDAMTFTVAVGECVVPGLGRLVLLAGESGKVPVNLISSVPLTNLSMTVEVQPALLTNLTLEPIVPEICGGTLTPALSHPMGEGVATPHPGPLLDRGGEGAAAAPREFYALSLSTCADQWLMGTQQVAWLHFQALSNHPSAFVALQLDITVGLQPNGVEVRNFALQAGHVVVVGEEPLLEAFFETNHLPALMLYAKTGTTNAIIASPSLTMPRDSWTAAPPVVMTNLYQRILPPVTNQWMFYQGRRE